MSRMRAQLENPEPLSGLERMENLTRSLKGFHAMLSVNDELSDKDLENVYELFQLIVSDADATFALLMKESNREGQRRAALSA